MNSLWHDSIWTHAPSEAILDVVPHPVLWGQMGAILALQLPASWASWEASLGAAHSCQGSGLLAAVALTLWE